MGVMLPFDPGIPEAEWERIFDRFYRLDASRSRRTGGSGLGLPITRAIVALFGGTVRVVESDTAGTALQSTVHGPRSQPPSTVDGAQATGDRLRAPGYTLPATGYRPRGTVNRRQVTG